MFVLSILIGIIAIAAIGAGLWFLIKPAPKVREPIRDRWGSTTGEYELVDGPGHKILGRWTILGGVLALLLAGLFLIFSSFYTQEAGEAKVLRDWTGNIDPTPSVASGGHWKAPWVDAIDWDVRNQWAFFTGDGTTTHQGQGVTGAELEFNDKEGVVGWLDIQVVYDIDPAKVVDLTLDYPDQQAFKTTVVENDIKSLPRDVLSKRTTLATYQERPQIRTEIFKLLEESWADKGVSVKSVTIHGIRRPADVEQRFQDAQNAQTEVVKAKAEAEVARQKAQGEKDAAITAAEGQAEANRLLNASLTDKILQQRWIDAVAKSGTIIVPEDFTSLGNLTPSGGQ